MKNFKLALVLLAMPYAMIAHDIISKQLQDEFRNYYQLAMLIETHENNPTASKEAVDLYASYKYPRTIYSQRPIDSDDSIIRTIDEKIDARLQSKKRSSSKDEQDITALFSAYNACINKEGTENTSTDCTRALLPQYKELKNDHGIVDNMEFFILSRMHS